MSIYQPTIALNEQGDSYLDHNGNIAMLYGVDSVAQTVSTNLRLWLGEYDFNTTVGMPYQTIMGEKLNKVLLYSYVKDVVISTPYVTKVNKIDFVQDRENRITTINVNFDTTETKGVAVNAVI